MVDTIDGHANLGELVSGAEDAAEGLDRDEDVVVAEVVARGIDADDGELALAEGQLHGVRKGPSSSSVEPQALARVKPPDHGDILTRVGGAQAATHHDPGVLVVYLADRPHRRARRQADDHGIGVGF